MTSEVAVLDPLHLTEQTIETLHLAAYWRACCPYLTCFRDSAAERRCEVSTEAIPTFDSEPLTGAVDLLKANLNTRGYFKLSSEQLAINPAVIEALGRGALRLLELGHSPSALLAFDEAWSVSAAVNTLLSTVTGNFATGDYYTFVVSPGRHEFAGPHRDKPAAGGESPSFRIDGSPGYVTAWLALTAASPETSCLYFVPASDDPGYRTPGDSLAAALPGPASWGNIVAQPCAAGALLCFSHRLVHWGSRAQPSADPRVALSWALADGAFESPIFDAAAFGPFPPLELRIALRAGQALAYAAQAPLSRAQLALDTRLFHAGARFFSDVWRDRIASAAQMELFRQKNVSVARSMRR
jgi:hypothetical protein